MRQLSDYENKQIKVEQLCQQYGLEYQLFPDRPTLPTTQQMALFSRASVVVAPHGAGLANLLYAKPGSVVLEALCEQPYLNMCFQRLATVLGMRYHALVSTGGCEAVIHINTEHFISALKQLLLLYFPST